MYYAGIDYHKRYSVVSVVNGAGTRLHQGRVEGNGAEGFTRFFKQVGSPVKVVLEASWNWGKVYDVLEDLEAVKHITLAHPAKTRMIAEAQIKTDKLDSHVLAQLLRADLVATSYVPSRETRESKEVVRQRLFWVRLRTMIRNRIHILLDRQRDLDIPQLRDLFGKRGMAWLEKLALPEPDGQLLKQDVAMLRALNEHIGEIEKQVERWSKEDKRIEHLMSIPGVGVILGSVIALEIDNIERFRTPRKLLSYTGLVPTTKASGGKVYHGRLLVHCNKWLRWAFVEAAWVAVSCSGYFGSLYRKHRDRGKKANTAITIVARRIAEIAWHVLRENRNYREQSLTMRKLPARSHQDVAVA
jgi:transposase